jgi:hypothetical protein
MRLEMIEVNRDIRNAQPAPARFHPLMLTHVACVLIQPATELQQENIKNSRRRAARTQGKMRRCV